MECLLVTTLKEGPVWTYDKAHRVCLDSIQKLSQFHGARFQSRKIKLECLIRRFVLRRR